MHEDILSELNTKQREAALHTEGPLLVVAGAGAGKTRTIAYRILHLVRQGIPPDTILAITFTNKAAQEMRERIQDLLAHDPRINLPVHTPIYPFVSTFHRLGVHMIREHTRLVGVTRHFKIFDRDDSVRAIKQALKREGFDSREHDPLKILSAISREKNAGHSLQFFLEKSEAEVGPRPRSALVGMIWNRYQEALRESNALDFDDLLLVTLELLRKHSEVRERYQKCWKYIHIDEYQDTNFVQCEIAQLLAQAHQNICVVGDADQMIYGWRGARIENILSFEHEYPRARTIILDENYRSTETILSAANSVIEKNVERVPKALHTKRGQGELISMIHAADEVDEAERITSEIESLLRAGVSGNEIAVLYRANFQSRALEEAFLSKRIPHQVLGTKFYDRREVKDMLAFVRAALHPNPHDVARIANVPPRGIGKVTLAKMLSGERHTLSPKVGQKVDAFYLFLDQVGEKAKTHVPSEVLRFILESSNLLSHLKEGGEDDHERLENIYELISIAQRYDAHGALLGIEALLEDAALASDQDSLRDQNGEGAVKLMTVHASKGLEFKYVYIAGLEEGLFPSDFSSEKETRSLQEEERRLFYVALTRAKEKLFLSFAATRTIFGNKQTMAPSSFLEDIDPSLCEGDFSTPLMTVYLD